MRPAVPVRSRFVELGVGQRQRQRSSLRAASLRECTHARSGLMKLYYDLVIWSVTCTVMVAFCMHKFTLNLVTLINYNLTTIFICANLPIFRATASVRLNLLW